MFGMLDYRAYKLFWLLGLPFRIIWRLLWFAIIALAVLVARWTEYPPLAQIVVAYLAMEGLSLIASILWLIVITWPVETAFFWLIDVVPSRGEDLEEAKEIVRKGPVVWLVKKMTNDIGNWTYEDTQQFIKAATSWRARRWFDARNKVYKRVEVLKNTYDETGKQPGELPKDELDKLLKPYKPGWFEMAITYGWNSILGLAIIVCAILYLQP
jgi:hypothetical protein